MMNETKCKSCPNKPEIIELVILCTPPFSGEVILKAFFNKEDAVKYAKEKNKERKGVDRYYTIPVSIY